MSHTPGPWTITDDEFEGEQWLWIDGANGHTVCGFSDPDTGITDQHREDARLIAAAPDLLDAAVQAFLVLSAELDYTAADRASTREMLDAAITKATQP